MDVECAMHTPPGIEVDVFVPVGILLATMEPSVLQSKNVVLPQILLVMWLSWFPFFLGFLLRILLALIVGLEVCLFWLGK
jgi:hypothetical protein